MMFDPMYFVFMIPGVILMLWAQSRVKGSYAKYSKVRNDVNMTGAQVARRILDAPSREMSADADPRRGTAGQRMWRLFSF